MKIGDYTGGGNYLFASNLTGVQFTLLDLELHEGQELEGDLQGRWLHVEVEGEFEDGYISAVGELIEELQRFGAEPGETYHVTRCKKSGEAQTDPYEVNLEQVAAEQSQARLD